MNENTTNAVPDIIDTLNGYVIIPIETLEKLIRAETRASIVYRILVEDRMTSYDQLDTIRAVFDAYPPKPKKEDEE